MLVVICEQILARDFFCAPPAALNGAMVEGRVVEAIILDEYGDRYDNEELKQVSRMLTVKLGESLSSVIRHPSSVIRHPSSIIRPHDTGERG